MSDTLTDGDKLDLLYHQTCREIAKDLGGLLIGATRGRGFSMFYKGKAIEIEGGYRMLVEDQQAELTRLRTELAEVRADISKAHMTVALSVVLNEQDVHKIGTLVMANALLRAELAVAREGLENFASGDNECISRGDFEERAQGYLAKLAAGKAGEEEKV